MSPNTGPDPIDSILKAALDVEEDCDIRQWMVAIFEHGEGTCHQQQLNGKAAPQEAA